MARPRLERIREVIEDRVGVAVRATSEVARLEESDRNHGILANEASELALHSQQYIQGRPQEMVFERRHRLAQRARIAFLWDPIIGREVEMLADFVLGNGLAIPRAEDAQVQKVIDEAWKDPKAKEVLTGFQAQRAVIVDLKTQANLFLALYESGGKVRPTFLDADLIREVVPDPEDETRPLYYIGRRRVFRWDPELDQPKFEDSWMQQDGTMKVTYYCHDTATETLTEDGWLSLESLQARKGDLPAVATVADGELRYEKPRGLHVFPFEGELLHFETQIGVDLAVTEDHRMLVRDDGGPWRFRPARELERQRHHETAGIYSGHTALLAAALEERGHRQATFTLPAWAKARSRAEGGIAVAVRGHVAPARTLDMDAWLRWLGWWLAEGSAKAQVTQALSSPYLGEIQAACRGLGIEGREWQDERLWRWRPRAARQVETWLDEHAGSGAAAKRVPRFVFDLGREQQMLVLRGLMLGDGRVHPAWESSGGSEFASCSRQLADDVQRLALHCGFRARLGRQMDYTRDDGTQRTMWRVTLHRGSPNKGGVTARLPFPVRRPYRGEVYCLTTPSGTMVTRRNGHVGIHGNSHWRNIEDAEEERQETQDLEPLPVIPREKMDPGDARVYHLRLNRLGRQHFGIPPMARSLRFASAMNQFTESRVSRALASAAFVAQRIRKDGPRGILNAASAVLRQTGELGTRGYRDDAPQGYGPAQPGQPPVPAGSWWVGNESDRLESLDLRSGGGEAQADANIIRAPLAAASGFGQHYLGDQSSATLASSTALELPPLMMTQAFQELVEELYRHFTDQAIEAAVRAGRLGGTTNREDGDKPLVELRLCEAEDLAQAQRRTGKTFDYQFEMPYPGRRNLPEVAGAFQTVMQTANTIGIGANEPLLKAALDFLFKHGFQLTNSSEVVEEVIDAWTKERESAAADLAKLAAQQSMSGGNGAPGGNPNQPNNPENQSQYGEQQASQGGAMSQEAVGIWVPEKLRQEVGDFEDQAGQLFRRLVTTPAVIAALANGASSPRS